jgi:hypothetical protein
VVGGQWARRLAWCHSCQQLRGRQTHFHLLPHRKPGPRKIEFSTSISSDPPNFTDAKAHHASRAIAPSLVTFLRSILDIWRSLRF